MERMRGATGSMMLSCSLTRSKRAIRNGGFRPPSRKAAMSPAKTTTS
jgi:hypothetical protein